MWSARPRPRARTTGLRPRRGGPWLDVKDESRTSKRPPRTNPLRTAPTGPTPLGDPRDRAATPPEWYDPFREATWDEALELTAQELVRLRDMSGPNSLAVFQSAKCSNEENYLLQRMFRGGIGTNNVDHCTRLCHSSSVSAMQRASDWKMGTLAIAPFGLGAGNLEVEDCAELMVDVIREHMARTRHPMAVTIVLESAIEKEVFAAALGRVAR